MVNKLLALNISISLYFWCWQKARIHTPPPPQKKEPKFYEQQTKICFTKNKDPFYLGKDGAHISELHQIQSYWIRVCENY